MREIFPYEGRSVTVTQDMCDFNGHMNVNHIKAVFEQGWEFGSKEFGFDDDYFKEGFSSFTMEDNYRFAKEFLLDQVIYPRFKLFNVNEKLFHMIGALFDSEENICAMYETIEGHIDMSLRKIAPMKSSMLENMLDIKKSHDACGEPPYDIRLKIRDLKK